MSIIRVPKNIPVGQKRSGKFLTKLIIYAAHEIIEINDVYDLNIKQQNVPVSESTIDSVKAYTDMQTALKQTYTYLETVAKGTDTTTQRTNILLAFNTVRDAIKTPYDTIMCHKLSKCLEKAYDNSSPTIPNYQKRELQKAFEFE